MNYEEATSGHEVDKDEGIIYFNEEEEEEKFKTAGENGTENEDASMLSRI